MEAEVMKIEELRGLRKRLGIQQASLAREIGVERSRLCMWENGYLDLKPEEVARVQSYLANELDTVKALTIPLLRVTQ
jgi:predicted transcriptional regulator